MLKRMSALIIVALAFIGAFAAIFEKAWFGGQTTTITIAASAVYLAAWIVGFFLLFRAHANRGLVLARIYWIAVFAASLLILLINFVNVNLGFFETALLFLALFAVPLNGFAAGVISSQVSIAAIAIVLIVVPGILERRLIPRKDKDHFFSGSI
jgi:hypothetical protein